VYGFAETHFEDSDASAYSFPLPGYTHYWLCREPPRKGGGISVFVHDSIKHVLVSKLFQPEVILLSLGNLELLLAFVYNPPENLRVAGPSTRHDSAQASVWFQNVRDLVIQSTPHSYTCLVGDFNARVGTWQMQSDPHPLQPDLPFGFQFPPRSSCDLIQNSFGPPLISMLSSLGLGLLNGCVSGDLSGAFTRFPPISPNAGVFADMFDSDEDLPGQSTVFVPFSPHTPTQSSVLDLVAVTPDLLPLAKSLHVTPSPISDHASLHVQLAPNTVSRVAITHPVHGHTPRSWDIWDDEFKALYQQQVQRDLPLLQQIVMSLRHGGTPRAIARTARAYMSRLKRCKAKALHAQRSAPRPSSIANPPGTLNAQEYWSRDLKVLHRKLLDLHHRYRATGQGQ